MGSTRHHIRPVRRTTLAAIAAFGTIALAACSGSGGDDDSTAATAPTAALDASALGDVESVGESSGDAAAPVPAAAPGGSEAPESGRSGAVDATTMQVPGQAIAIEAHATIQADDVKAAVGRITTTVTTRGGRVAAADISTPDDADGATARATLVLEVPPGELTAVNAALADAGTVTSYTQSAEDVTDQLTDLDTRIANMRASTERVRALYASAVDIDSIVRLEAELTNRETQLEQLLATQAGLEDRVAMSTLTVDIAVTPAVLEPADDDTGLGDALAAGWSAFAGALFAIVLVLAAAMPFVLTVIVLGLLALSVRQLIRRGGRHQAAPQAEERPAPQEPVSASRPE